MKARDAYGLGIALMLTAGAHAQGFADSTGTCYSWNGGNHSSGSFIKCNGPDLKPAPQRVAAVLPAPQIAPSPIMAPQVSCVPPPKPVVKPKRKAPLKC
jgi:hypothetical protein